MWRRATFKHPERDHQRLKLDNAIMFRATCRRLAQQVSATGKKEPLTIHNNPYRAHKVWPPDFSQLTPQQALRFEKKHKRRVALAGHSPRWDKGVRLARFFSIVGELTDVFGVSRLTAAVCLIVMVFGAEYQFHGSDYVYKPTQEVGMSPDEGALLTAADYTKDRTFVWPHG